MLKIYYTMHAAPVASAIFVATIVVSLIGFRNPGFRDRLLLHPWAFFRERRYHTAISSGFVHADWQHLALNMFAFALFGFQLERYMGYLQSTHLQDGMAAYLQSDGYRILNRIWGHGKFLLLYLICLVLADVYSIIRHRKHAEYSSLGASGAISGVLMGAIVLSHAMREDIRLLGFLPGWMFVLAYLAYTLIAALRFRKKVDHTAHLWGAVAGLLLTGAFFPYEMWLFVRVMLGT